MYIQSEWKHYNYLEGILLTTDKTWLLKFLHKTKIPTFILLIWNNFFV